MTHSLCHVDLSPSIARFKERCEALGLIALIMRSGHLVEAPDNPPLPWRALSAAMHEVLNDCGEADDVDGFEQVDEGLAIARFAWDDGLEETHVLALAIDSRLADAPRFASWCAEDSLDLAAAGDAIRDLPPRDIASLNDKRNALRWSHEDLCEANQQNMSLEQFSDALTDAYEQTDLLFKVSRLVHNVHDPRQLLNSLVSQLHQTLHLGWVVVAMKQGGCVLQDLSSFRAIAGTPPTGDAFDRAMEQLVGGANADSWTRILSPDRHDLARIAGTEVVAEVIFHDGEVIGVLLAGGKQTADTDIHSSEVQFLDAVAEFLGVFHENQARFAEQQAMFMGTLKAMTAAIDAKDRYTRGHSQRVAYLGKQLAIAAGLDEKTCEDVYVSGLVHDVGKIGVPEAVLCKAGRPTDEEFAMLKRHPVIGYEILRDIPPMEKLLDGVLHHHERYDGHGYPHGLAGEDIPLFGRILAVGDTFDAMCSTRSYRAAMPLEKAIAEIERCAGTQFDPQLAKAFVTLGFDEYQTMLERDRTLSVFAA